MPKLNITWQTTINGRTETLEIKALSDAPHRLGVYQTSAYEGSAIPKKLLTSSTAEDYSRLFEYAETTIERLHMHYSRQNI